MSADDHPHSSNDHHESHGNDENHQNVSSFHSTPQFELRCLIDNSSVGGLIGRGGSNVKRVREESSAFVSILPTEQRNVSERILTIKGSIEAIGKASQIISVLLVESSSDRPSESTSLKLLVHKSAVGAIIGKAGAVIKETQTETGARVQVSNEPIGSSTDKTVTITGSPSQLHDAVSRIAQQLKDSPLKPGVRVNNYVPGSHNSGGSYHGGRTGNSHFDSHERSSNPSTSNIPAGSQTQKIAIPTLCAGCVIGRGGTVIRDLRSQSGTNISIQDPDPSSPNERVVTLTGTREGIQTAVYLIRQLVEHYQPNGNNGQRQSREQEYDS